MLHLAKPEDIAPLTKLVAAFHYGEGIELSDEAREAALSPLLEGSPYGVVYLIGPKRAPLGYIAVTFAWSLEFGGLDAMIDEVFIRPAVRRRGIAGEALLQLLKSLQKTDVQAVHLEVDRDNEDARRLYERLGFQLREKYHLMSRSL